MIYIETKNLNQNFDLSLSDYSEIGDFSAALKEKISSRQSQIITVRLLPPVHSSCSIPLAFKEIVKADNQYSSEDLKLKVIIHPEAKNHLIKFMPDDQKLSFTSRIHKVKLIIEAGDIIESKAEAIVNASNKNLRLGGGVSGAIKKATHPTLQNDLTKIAHVKIVHDGDAIVTESYGLKNIKKIIHVATDIGTPEVLAMGIENTLKRCQEENLKSVSFPALATGAGGMKPGVVATIFKNSFESFLNNLKEPVIEKIIITLFEAEDYNEFIAIFSSRKS